MKKFIRSLRNLFFKIQRKIIIFFKRKVKYVEKSSAETKYVEKSSAETIGIQELNEENINNFSHNYTHPMIFKKDKSILEYDVDIKAAVKKVGTFYIRNKINGRVVVDKGTIDDMKYKYNENYEVAEPDTNGDNKGYEL